MADVLDGAAVEISKVEAVDMEVVKGSGGELIIRSIYVA
jgi:hypothetical protein